MQENLRILYIDTPIDPPGGGQFSLLLLLKQLDRKRYSPFVFTPDISEFNRWLEKDKIENKAVALGKLFNEIRNIRPHIIHSNSSTTRYAFLSALYARLFGIPFVWHVRVVQKARVKDEIIYFLSTAVIAISSAVRNKFLRTEKTVVISNGTDTSVFRPGIDTEHLRAELSLSREEKIIGAVGRLDKWKGHHLFIDMAKAVSEKIPAVRFLIVGDGTEPYLSSLKGYAESLGLKEKMIFLGYRKDVPELIALMDVVVQSSGRHEAFGRVIIEAMAGAKPVLALNSGGALDIITDGVNGILVPEDQPHEMAKACITLLTNSELCKSIGKNAREHVEKHFTHEQTAVKVMELYERII